MGDMRQANDAPQPPVVLGIAAWGSLAPLIGETFGRTTDRLDGCVAMDARGARPWVGNTARVYDNGRAADLREPAAVFVGLPSTYSAEAGLLSPS